MPFASDLKRKEVAGWWSNPNTFGTALLALAIDEFGTECFGWEPETIRMEVQDTYHITLPQANMDKLMAMITALSTNLFYVSVESFTHIANALNDSEADFYTWDPVDADEAAWAITEVALSDAPRPRESFEDRFSHDVRRYVGVIVTDEGIVSPPDVLGIAEMDPSVQKAADVTFADDPSMFAGFYRLSQEKANDVTQYVRKRTAALLNQLQRLPLQNRDEKTWSKFLDRAQHSKALSGIAG